MNDLQRSNLATEEFFPKASILTDLRFCDEHTRLLARRSGVGSSDVPVLMGYHQYNTPYTLWLDKTGKTDIDTQSSDEAEWGKTLEPVIAERFADRFGAELLGSPYILQSDRTPHHLASPDNAAVTPLGSGIVECKNRAHQWTEGIPQEIDDQCQWLLHVSGLDRVWVAVLFMGMQMPPPFVVTRNEPRIAEICERVDRFWAHVQFDEPPPFTAEDTKQHVPAHDQLPIETDSELIGLLEERAEFKAVEKEAKKKAEAVSDRIRLALADHRQAVLPDGQVAVTYEASSRRSIDYDAFTAAHPELAEEWIRTTPSRTLRPKKVEL